MTATPRPPRIMMRAHSQFRGAYRAVVENLVKDYSAVVRLYVTTEQKAKFYRNHNLHLFESIQISDGMYRFFREAVTEEKEVLQQAAANERFLGTTISALSMSDRHLGRGFALAGSGHPRSRISNNTSYCQLLNGYNKEIQYWRDQIEEFDPDLVLNPNALLHTIIQKYAVAGRTFALSRNRNDYYWTSNKFFEFPSGTLDAISLSDAPEVAPEDRPLDAYTSYRKLNDRNAHFWPTIKNSMEMTAYYTYWKLRRYEKAKGYYLREHLKYLWRRRRDTIRMSQKSLPTLDDLKGTKFVFFTLATEPEVALQTLSPEYFFQLSCIASICRDLPAGYTLIVKEHATAVGRRPKEFYDQILEFKNARFMNMHEHGFFVAKEASAVATINGTVGFEAAIMGKPVIVYGRHNLYAELPHVQAITDEVQVREALRKALLEDWPNAKRDGRRFLGKLRAASFDMGTYSPWTPDEVPEEAAAAATGSLISGCAEIFRKSNA